MGSYAVVLCCMLLCRSIAATPRVTVLLEMEGLSDSQLGLVASERQLVPKGQIIFKAVG